MQDQNQTNQPEPIEVDEPSVADFEDPSSAVPIPETLTPKQRATKFMLAAVPLVIVILFFAYLWMMSGVLPVVERYPDETVRVNGFVKREGGQYKATGAWVTFHPNGKKASEGRYAHGDKVPGTWHYWDEQGKELPDEPEGASPIARQP